ncbi:MAG: hypothetical protein JW703_02705 [Candidatus Diapherotrites archaeon]|nr:hypothetical protein [Candidatus Diapherotrites archaeon]
MPMRKIQTQKRLTPAQIKANFAEHVKKEKRILDDIRAQQKKKKIKPTVILPSELQAKLAELDWLAGKSKSRVPKRK